MQTKIALLIVFNHRFDRNIPRLNELYKNKFSNVYHVVPFYNGTDANVIPVYENSYNFQGYIAQAYSHLKDKGFTHYFVVADDMIINPAINENSFWEVTGIPQDACYIDIYRDLSKEDHLWFQERALDYDPFACAGVEVKDILPNAEDAANLLAKYGISFAPFNRNILLKTPSLKKKIKNLFCRNMPLYPLVGGYSDILLITEEVMPKFCQISGALAATRLFVELAIPTALAFCSAKIVFNRDIKLREGALWTDEDKKVLDKYENSLTKLLDQYPNDMFYYHPIKLSKWK